jgi:hypothetical protein
LAIVRVSFDNFEEGEQYRNRLIDEANRILKIFLNLLSSYWTSSIDGPNYVREIKAISLELARLKLGLEDIRTDTQYSKTRSDFLYQIVTSVLFPKKDPGAPNPNFSDLDFKDFLLKVLDIYFQGSIPDSMSKAVALFVNGKIRVTEAFLEARQPGSGFDISDQFAFIIDIILDSPGSTDVFLADRNVRILLNIIRPAHTLYRLGFILQDDWPGQKSPDPDNPNQSKMIDSFQSILSNYGYEDFRRFIEGIYGVDELGFKKPIQIINEDHSRSF